MTTVKLVLLCGAFALFLIACNGGASNTTTTTTNSNTATTNTAATNTGAKPQASPTDQFASVRPMYIQRCADCHGKEGNGGPVVIAGKNLKVPSLREGHVLNHSEAELAKKISNGGGGMPPFGKVLKPEEIDSIVQFIKKDIEAPSAAPSPAAK